MRANMGVILLGLAVSVALYLTGNTSPVLPALPVISVIESTLLLVGLGAFWMLLTRITGHESHALVTWLFLGAVLLMLFSFNTDWPIPYRLILLTAMLVGLALIKTSRAWVAMMAVSATLFIPWMIGGGFQTYFATAAPTYMLVLGSLGSGSFIPLLMFIQRVRARPHTHFGPWIHFAAIGGVLILMAVVSYSSGVAVSQETNRLGAAQMEVDRLGAINKVSESIEAEMNRFSEDTGGQNILDVTSELAAGGGFKILVFDLSGPDNEGPTLVLGAWPKGDIISPSEFYTAANKGEVAVVEEFLQGRIGSLDPIFLHSWGGSPVLKVIGDDDLAVVLVSSHPFWWGKAETDLFARRALDAFYVWIYLALLFPLSLSLFVQAKREDALTKAGEEQERARVRQDVHDRVTNRLSALAVESETVVVSRSGAEEFNQGLPGVLRRVVEELALISGPKRQGELGSLVDTVSLLSAERAGELRLSLDIQIDEGLNDVVLTRDETLTLEAILGEAIANASRHSGAGKVSVSLHSIGEGVIELEIADDGAGFEVPADLSSMVDEGHLGLAGMERRMRGMGGQLDVVSSPGQGCRIIVRWTNE